MGASKHRDRSTPRWAIVLAGASLLAVVLAAGRARADSEAASVAQWARFEASYTPEDVPANPFDPDEIDVRAVFTAPDGRTLEVLAFWNRDYTRALVNDRERLTPVGEPHFAVRFTPDAAGLWSWRWVIRRGGETEELDPTPLEVLPAQGRGFLRVSPHDARYLAFDDGSPYFAVGENTAWYGARGTFDYDDWFGALEAQQANYGRLWMPSWAFGIEWSETGLGDYTNRLDRAWRLDYVMEEAERRGIYVMLSLLNHGAFSTVFNSEWDANPYKAANGGPLASPGEFFTNEEAQKLFERRLRYIVARWGWSTHLLAWELWNEADLTDGYNATASVPWHARMSSLLRTLDPYDHLVTTSFSLMFRDTSVWRNGGVDFTQVHYYASVFPEFANLAETIVTRSENRIEGFHKPVLFSELGVSDTLEGNVVDPAGIGVHDGLWAGVVSGGMGTAMTWWWDNLIAVQPELYYPMFGSVARFVDGVRWDREGFARFDGEVASSSGSVLHYGLRGEDTLLLWIKDDEFQWNFPNARVISDATLDVPGPCSGRWYDPWTGEWLGDVLLHGETPVPAFSRDIALRASCPGLCQATGCKEAGESLLQLENHPTDDRKDELVWKWLDGAETTVAELGVPTATTEYFLCLQAGTTVEWIHIPSGAGWRRLGAKGFRRKDRSATPDGVQAAVIQSGKVGKARAVVEGKGANLPDSLSPPLALPVKAQLVNDANGTCFEAVYDLSDVVENGVKYFKAKTR